MILNVIRRQNSKLFVVVDIPSRISYNSITSMIKVIRMINSENFDIPFRSIVILLFIVLLSSCLKETAVPIESAFSIESSEDKTSPVTIQLKNESYGAHRGRFASPKRSDGTMFPFQNRALRGDETDYIEFYDLVVLKDISVEQGSIIPWFNQPGQGTQIMLSEDIEELIKEGK